MFDKENLDAVFVAVSPEKHFEICSNALLKGLHVFVEKPATNNSADALKLCDVAKKSGKHIMVAFMKRFAPTYKMAKEIIGTEKFGIVNGINAKFCVGRCGDENKFLVECAIHYIDLLRFFGGAIKHLHVEKQSSGKELFSFAILIRFINNAVGSLFLSTSQSWHGHGERIELFGNNQTLIVDNVIQLKHYTDSGLIQGEGTQVHRNNVFWEPDFTVPSQHNQGLFLNGFAYEIEHFTSSILRGRPPESDMINFYEDMKIMESIRDYSR